jgi:hypothetical protein
MAYENFKKLLWSRQIELELPKFTVFKNDCDFKFEGEIKKGARLKILGVSRPTIKAYTNGQEIDAAETVPDASVYLDIDQADYVNYEVGDVDKAQMQEGLMEALSTETTRGFAEKEDSFIAKLCGENAGGYSASTAVATEADAKKLVDSAIVYLWTKGVKVGRDSVTMYLSPWFYMLFQNKIIDLKTSNDTLISQGVLGMYNGVKIKMSNNLYNDNTDDYIVIKTSKAVAYANGIDELEAYRPEKKFADAIKGLNVYGGKAVRPKEMYVIKAREAVSA